MTWPRVALVALVLLVPASCAGWAVAHAPARQASQEVDHLGVPVPGLTEPTAIQVSQVDCLTSGACTSASRTWSARANRLTLGEFSVPLQTWAASHSLNASPAQWVCGRGMGRFGLPSNGFLCNIGLGHPRDGQSSFVAITFANDLPADVKTAVPGDNAAPGAFQRLAAYQLATVSLQVVQKA